MGPRGGTTHTQQGVTAGNRARGRDRLAPGVPNAEGKRGTHMVIGPDRRGRFWTIIMLRARNGRWRPITGWPSKRNEIDLYNRNQP